MKYLQIALNVPANQTFTYANVEAGKRVAQEEKEQNEIEKPKVNIDVDSVVVNNNNHSEDFFDDFFGSEGEQLTIHLFFIYYNGDNI